MTEYPYTKRNLLELPKEHYMYSAFSGESFLFAYSNNRKDFIERFFSRKYRFSYLFTKEVLKNSGCSIQSEYIESKTTNLEFADLLLDFLKKTKKSLNKELFIDEHILPLIKKFEVTKRIMSIEYSKENFIVYPMFANVLVRLCKNKFDVVLFNALLKINDICVSVFLSGQEELEEELLLTIISVRNELEIYNNFKETI
ncbi:MAG: hypothetical protein WCJ92_04720 [Alphaproteobacteria bacterium]